MMMFDFSLLAMEEQLDLLYKEGVFVGKLLKNKVYKVLYQYQCFYVEITYRKYRYSVKEIRCFESTEMLDPYLTKIDIELLINC
ncbi:MAG TPA: hypothetical protein VJ499_05255 [Flavisolibacter sp.]|nr:hypothetical protein [Flavisolibacter sp.]